VIAAKLEQAVVAAILAATATGAPNMPTILLPRSDVVSAAKPYRITAQFADTAATPAGHRPATAQFAIRLCRAEPGLTADPVSVTARIPVDASGRAVAELDVQHLAEGEYQGEIKVVTEKDFLKFNWRIIPIVVKTSFSDSYNAGMCQHLNNKLFPIIWRLGTIIRVYSSACKNLRMIFSEPDGNF